MLAITRHPTQSFAIHLISALANSVYSTIIARTLRIFIEPRAQTEGLKRAGKLALSAAIHVEARELPAKLCTYEAIAHALEIIFKVNKASAQSNVAGEINPVGGERTGAVALLLQGLPERRQSF